MITQKTMEDKRYFDHDADMGIIGRGVTVESAFIDAANAVFDLMFDRTILKETRVITFDFLEENLEWAFVEWLNTLLANARAERMVFTRFELTRSNAHWHAKAWGEPWSEKIELGVEVKGATLTMLSVKKDQKQWIAQCVVDV